MTDAKSLAIGIGWSICMANMAIQLLRILRSVWRKWSMLRDLRRLERLRVLATRLATRDTLTRKERLELAKLHVWLVKSVGRCCCADPPDRM